MLAATQGVPLLASIGDNGRGRPATSAAAAAASPAADGAARIASSARDFAGEASSLVKVQHVLLLLTVCRQ